MVGWEVDLSVTYTVKYIFPIEVAGKLMRPPLEYPMEALYRTLRYQQLIPDNGLMSLTL